MPRLLGLTLLCLLGISQPASTAAFGYTCNVLELYQLSDEGTLVKDPFSDAMAGKTFSISRTTGQVIGEVLATFWPDSMRVINEGSTANSFKTVASAGGQVQVLEVQEFRDGPVKPFIAMSMGGAGLVTGTCK